MTTLAQLPALELLKDAPSVVPRLRACNGQPAAAAEAAGHDGAAAPGGGMWLKEVKIGLGSDTAALRAAAASLHAAGASAVHPGVWRLPAAPGVGSAHAAAVRVLPSHSSTIVFAVGSLDMAAARMRERNLAVAPIGRTGREGRAGEGQLVLELPPLHGLEARLCASPALSPVFHEAQDAVVTADPRYIEELQGGANASVLVKNCWAEFRATVARPLMMYTSPAAGYRKNNARTPSLRE
eukprot:g3816.t1